VEKNENIQHHGSVKGISVSTSAESLAICSVDCIAKVWDTKFLEVVKTTRGHTNSISAVCLSHSGKQIAQALRTKKSKYEKSILKPKLRVTHPRKQPSPS